MARRTTPSRPGPQKRSPAGSGPDLMTWVGIGVAVVVVALGIGLATSGGGSAEATEVAPVRIAADEGLPLMSELPGFDDGADGLPAPGATGSTFDGSATELLSDDEATIVVFLAHWCPHCRAEVPVVVDELGGQLPDGVDLVGVPTATSSAQANYPPSAWLEAEDWPFRVLVDSEESDLAAAYGIRSFPAFVVVGADGEVVTRASGELTLDQLDQLVRAAAGAA